MSPLPETPFDTTQHQLRAARGGDRGAMNALFARYLDWVVETVALRLGRWRADCGDLEDIAQESLLDAFRSMNSFEHRTEGSFRMWLARIVEHNVIDDSRRRRAQKRHGAATPQDVHALDLAGEDPTPSRMAGQREDQLLVERAMLQLPVRTREILILRDRCCMTFDEVAATIGLGNAESARTTYRRALQALAASLQSVGKRS